MWLAIILFVQTYGDDREIVVTSSQVECLAVIEAIASNYDNSVGSGNRLRKRSVCVEVQQ